MRLWSVIAVCSLVVACKHGTADDTPVGPSETGADTGSPGDLFAADPTVMAPETLVGGARRVVVEATEPASLELTLTGPGGSKTIRWPESTSFEVPLVGLRPDAAHTLTLTLTSNDGPSAERTVEVTGDSLPANLPDLDVLTLQEDAVAPGHTLFATTSPGAPGAWLLLLDAQGQPVWWSYQEVRLGGLELTDDGTLIGLGEADIVEVDWLGNPIQHLTSRPDGVGTSIPDASYVHHELVRLDNGNLLTLDHVAAGVDDLPANYTDLATLGPGAVADDRILEIDAAGQVVQTVSLAERLPTSRISFDSLEPIDSLGGAADWAHADAIAVDDDGGWVISLRHQDALVKLDDEGDVAWILGDPAGWPAPWSTQLLLPDGAVVWPYHQHAPELRRDSDGLHVLLFDNVNEGYTPYGKPTGFRPSRLVEFVVDEAAGTVRQEWSFELEAEGPLAAFALGDADRLANDHVLGVWGMLSEEKGATNASQGRANLSARIAEVDPVTDDVVFDLRVGWPRSRGVEGWTVYRAERLPRLHPTALAEE